MMLKTKLKEIFLFTDDCISDIQKLVRKVNLSEKDYYSREGEYVKDLCLLESGILRIYYLDENGQEWNKHFMQEGDFVASSISPEKKSITNIQALSDVVLLKISYLELKKLSLVYPEIDTFIQSLSFKYLSQKQDREISLLSKQAKHHYIEFKKSYPLLENKIPLYHIASYLGITPIQLSRLRKKLKAE